MNQLDKEKKYQELHQLWSGLNDAHVPWFSNLSNAAALISDIFGHWWVGFYIVQNDCLYLGPFQGPTACTKIQFGKGVCGSAWEQQQTIVVPDVHQFPGHIACSAASNSEIVVPMFHEGKIWGVLDIDSVDFNTFDETDKRELEIFCASLSPII